MNGESSPATTWSIAFTTQLARSGVKHIVISPGSRSQALALAADALSRSNAIDLSVHVCIDERTAGFYGLGLAVDSGVPTALLCTSGSAPAHYLPALLEAKHSGIPLIALTADRPVELRGVGANQTTNQTGMFGSAVHASIDVEAPVDDEGLCQQARSYARDAVARSLSGAAEGRPGPVHLNIAFREPLSSPMATEALSSSDDAESDAEYSATRLAVPRTITLKPQPGTVVIAGHRAGPDAEQLARELGAVLIAEVHSGARFGQNLAGAYRQLLDSPPEGHQISRVVCVGRPTLSRQVERLISRDDIEQVVWQRDEPEPSNLSASAMVVDQITVSRMASESETRKWVAPWVTASRKYLEIDTERFDPPTPRVEDAASGDMPVRAGFAQQEMALVRRPVTRRDIAREVWSHTWPTDQLVLGSSRMIREFDTVAPGKKISVWANRGLSGIDGTVATARGLASSRSLRGLPGVTRVVLGDLALLHDAGSFLLQESERMNSKLQIFVVVDGGGSLFDSLEVADSADRSSYERVIFTPSQADLGSLAAAYGWRYRKATDLAGLSEALADTGGQLLVECPVDRAGH